MLKLMHHGTDDMARMMTMADPTAAALYLLCVDETIHLLVRPFPGSTLAGTSIIMGSLADKMGQVTPVLLAAQYCQSSFTTLIKKELVDLYALPHAIESPDDIPSFAGDQPSMERLNFYGSTDTPEERPCIAALPCIFPLPHGAEFPTEPWSIGTPQPDLEDAHPAIRAWRLGNKYVREHNEGKSVTRGGPLFDVSGITPVPFDGRLIVRHVNPVLNTLSVTDPQFMHVQTAMASFEDAAWERIGSNIIEPGPGNNDVESNCGATVTNQTLTLLADAIGTATKKSVTTSEKEHLDHAADIGRRYELMGASLTPVVNGETENQEVILGELTTEFVKFLQHSKLLPAQRILLEVFDGRLNTAHTSELRRDGNVKIEKSLIDATFAAAARSFKLMSDNLNLNPADVNNLISIITFASPDTASVHFQERQQAGQTVLVQESLNEEKSKMDKKTTTLYAGGRLSSLAHALEAIANFRMFGLCVWTNFEQSLLWTNLSEYAKILQSREAQKYDELYAENHPQLGAHAMAALQIIIAPLVKIANQSSLREALRLSQPVAAQTYDMANLSARNQTAALALEVSSSTMEKFTSVPYFTSALPQFQGKLQLDTSTQQKQPAQGDSKARSGTKPIVTPDAKSQTKAKATAAAAQVARDNPERTKGILQWSGPNPGYVKAEPIYWQAQGAKAAEKMCYHFVTQGSICGYPTNCRFHHPTSFKSIPKAAQDALVKEVANNEFLKFAPGHGPPGKN
jgi:hypothetical protein